MKLLFNKIVFVLLSTFLVAQSFTPINFNLSLDRNDSTKTKGLKSNIIAEIKLMGDSLTWFGTGQGLAMYDGNQLYSFLSNQDSLEDLEDINILVEGGIPAIATKGDTLAVSFSGDNGNIQVGKGLVISYNAQDTSGISWKYFQQPIDLETDTIKPSVKVITDVYQSQYLRLMSPMTLT